MEPTRFSSDRTGFPLVRLAQPALDVHVLPVTKLQFEQFLAEPNNFGDDWYQTLLQVNPRVSYRQFDAADREKLLLTGILPDEALAFARWLGPDFDLPTVDEWRAIFRALQSLSLAERRPSKGNAPKRQKPCDGVFRQLRGQLKPKTVFDLSLMSGGLLEWAHADSTCVVLGAPRPAFYRNLYDPLTDQIQPNDPPTHRPHRLAAFGFRLVRRRDGRVRGYLLYERTAPCGR